MKFEIKKIKGEVKRMNQMPGSCPVCANALHVTRLQCGQCGTGIDGIFGLGRLQALTAEQVRFVETFIKSRGKIKDVEQELKVSYPTVVARLNEVVLAMGYDVDERDLSEVEQYERYEAQVIQPRALPGNPGPHGPHAPHVPSPFSPPMPAPPAPPAAPKAPAPAQPRLSADEREKVLEELRSGKLSIEEAMKKLHGEV
jgi:hypothetical protein